MSVWPERYGTVANRLVRNTQNVPFKSDHKYAGKIPEYWTKTGSDGEPTYVLVDADYGTIFQLEEPLEGMTVCPFWDEDYRVTVTKAMLKELHSQFDSDGQPKSLSAPEGNGPDINGHEWGNAIPDDETLNLIKESRGNIGWYERAKELEDKELA